jgi:O-antigen/teichoic acid export membrane protein
LRWLDEILHQPGGQAATSGITRALSLPIIVVGLLATARLTIEHVGIDQYGFVALVSTISSLIVFLDFGLGASVTNAYATEAPERAFGTLQVVVRLLKRIALAVGALAATISLTVGWGWAFGSSMDSVPSGDLAIFIALLLFSLALPASVGQRVLVGERRSHLMALSQSVVGPIAFTTAYALRAADAPAGLFAASIPCGLCASAFCALFLSGKASVLRTPVRSSLELGRARLSSEVIRSARPMFVIMIGVPVAMQSDLVVLSHTVPQGALGVYSVVAQLYGAAWAIISSAGMALWPVFARRRKDSGFRRLYARMVGGFFLAGAVLAASLILAGPWVTRALISTETVLPEELLWAFGALLVVQSTHLPGGMVLTDEPGLRFQARCVAVMVIANLSLSLLLAKVIGLTGPVIASLATVGVCQLLPGMQRIALSGRRRRGRVAATA